MDTSSSNMAWTDPAALQKYGQEQYQLGKLSVALGAFSQVSSQLSWMIRSQHSDAVILGSST